VHRARKSALEDLGLVITTLGVLLLPGLCGALLGRWLLAPRVILFPFGVRIGSPGPVFELIGSILTRTARIRTGDAPPGNRG